MILHKMNLEPKTDGDASFDKIITFLSGSVSTRTLNIPEFFKKFEILYRELSPTAKAQLLDFMIFRFPSGFSDELKRILLSHPAKDLDSSGNDKTLSIVKDSGSILNSGTSRFSIQPHFRTDKLQFCNEFSEQLGIRFNPNVLAGTSLSGAKTDYNAGWASHYVLKELRMRSSNSEEVLQKFKDFMKTSDPLVLSPITYEEFYRDGTFKMVQSMMEEIPYTARGGFASWTDFSGCDIDIIEEFFISTVPAITEHLSIGLTYAEAKTLEQEKKACTVLKM